VPGRKLFQPLCAPKNGQSKMTAKTWFTAGGAIRIARYDVIDDVITQKL